MTHFAAVKIQMANNRAAFVFIFKLFLVYFWRLSCFPESSANYIKGTPWDKTFQL